MTIDGLDTKMSAEFAAVRAEMTTGFAAVRTEMTAEFAALRADMKTQTEGLDARIKADGETTRRRFDVVAEQFKEHTSPTASGGTPNGPTITNSESLRSKLAIVAGEHRRIGWPNAR